MNEENPMVLDCLWADSDRFDGDEDFEVCKLCGKPDENCVGGVCQRCLAKASTFENALKYGEDRKVAVELNGFLAYAFTNAEIEDALVSIIKESMASLGLQASSEMRDYCGDDPYDFADWLVEQNKGASV